MSRSGHRLYLHAGVRAAAETRLTGPQWGQTCKEPVLQGTVPLRSHSSGMKICLSDMPTGEMSWQGEDTQPAGTSHDQRTTSAAGQP